MIYIYHHLGLGDHILCNGLVRRFCCFQNVTLLCKPSNLKNIEYMYRDLPNLYLYPVESDYTADTLLSKYPNKFIKVGFDKLLSPTQDSFDMDFYVCAGLDPKIRFSDFFILRNLEKEQDILNNLNPHKKDYIFIHGDLDMSRIRSDLKIIRNPENINLFDLVGVLENAEEVHLMESSIKCLAGSIKMDKPKFFYHQYVRCYPDYYNTKSLNQFTTIK